MCSGINDIVCMSAAVRHLFMKDEHFRVVQLGDRLSDIHRTLFSQHFL